MAVPRLLTEEREERAAADVRKPGSLEAWKPGSTPKLSTADAPAVSWSGGPNKNGREEVFLSRTDIAARDGRHRGKDVSPKEKIGGVLLLRIRHAPGVTFVADQ